jgi:hypothetical protein
VGEEYEQAPQNAARASPAAKSPVRTPTGQIQILFM